MDPITDMLNQIKNAEAVKKAEVFVPLSNIKNEIAMILARCGFVVEAKKIVKGRTKNIRIILKYDDNNSPALTGFKRVSKPGQRIYKKFTEIGKVRQGYGISIVSTSKGLMINNEARKQRLGGEIICQVW